jgi:hypothetical protein
MHVPTLSAVSYRDTFTHGRSLPMLIWAESEDGARHEVVLKLHEPDRLGRDGLVAELVASLMARDLGLDTPPPFIVEVTPEFAASVPDPVASRRLLSSPGLHFASRLETGQFNLPFTKQILPVGAIDAAAAVMAFDLLIGNDDRHREKANCLVRGDRIVLIDHERAFPVVRRELRPSAWERGGLEHIHRHVFYESLKGQMPDLSGFNSRLEALTTAQIDRFLAPVPTSWADGDSQRRLRTFLLDLLKSYLSVTSSLLEALR